MKTTERTAMNSSPPVLDETNFDQWQPVRILGKLFRFYLLLPNHPFKVRVENLLGKTLFRRGIFLHGHSATLCLDANDWITRILLEEGNYEKHSLMLAKQLLAQGGNFLDVGANFGLYTCILGAIPKVRCIAVEPSPEMHLLLKRNLALNPSIHAIKAHVALSSSFNLARLFCPNDGNKGTSRIVIGQDDVLENYDIVACAPLFDLLDEIGISPIHLMKIDIEGHEMEVFKEFDFASKYRPANIIVEFVPSHVRDGLSLKAYGDFFRERGYSLYTVTGEPLDQDSEIPENNIWLKSAD